MAAPIPNFDILLSGILRDARRQPDAIAYLNNLHAAAWTAVKAGDEYVTTTSDEGGSNTAERGMTATTLLQLYELAIQEIEAESTLPASRSVRYGDFSSQPCTLG